MDPMVVDTHKPSVVPYLIVCVVSLSIFFGIGAAVMPANSPNALTQLDTQITSTLHDSKSASPGWTAFFEHLKELAGLFGIVGLVAVVVVVLLCYGRFWLAVAFVCAVEGIAFANDYVLKHFFQRERPPFAKPKGPTDWSFPSGHAIRAIVLYGFLAYLLVTLLPRRGARMAVILGGAAVVALVGFSRIYLGKHYLSDVLGSIAFGAGWLAAWIAVVEVMGWRTARRPASEPPTLPNTQTI
jgi:undecaprenyl-diphosphatase